MTDQERKERSTTFDYVKNQLNMIAFHGDYPAQVQFRSNGKATKCLSIDKNTAESIVTILVREFNIQL